ncbi:MAG: penicillin-binding transpeptidase domain-containing protein, partial [Bacteroidota bacterium]
MNQGLNRGTVLMASFALVIVLFICRLFYLQVMRSEYAVKANTADLEYVELYPARGIIYDRNENIYVKNSPIFDVMVIPKELTIPDTTILEEYLGLTRETIRKKIKKHKGIARFQWQPLATQLDKEKYGRFSEQMWQFEGLKVMTRPTREYNYPAGAHFLGYINEVDSNEIKRQIKASDTTDYKYKPGDLIGKIGIERRYEQTLRGKKGLKILLRDAYRRPMGPYAEGKYDELPGKGTDIQLGVDANLQVLGERLMQNKRGSIVAIEPRTGEILAFVSAPSYDPARLTGSDLGANYRTLALDAELPLVNRPLSAQYPPGSIFKILQALAAMSEGVINDGTHFSCGGAWFRNRGKPACHGAHGACSLPNGIKHSCNSFFAETYYSFLNHKSFPDIHDAYQRWFDIMKSYGVGQKLGVDIPDEKSGLLPQKEFYDKVYGKKGWGALTIY